MTGAGPHGPLPPGAVYQSDPDQQPDAEFVPGDLAHLVAGNAGRLLDPRRTPVHIVSVLPERGFFEVEIDAFEDAGARWLVPVEEAGSYQFRPDAALAAGRNLADLRAAAARGDVRVSMTAGPERRAATGRQLRAEQARAAAWLAGHGAPASFDPRPLITDADGWPAARSWLREYLAARRMSSLDRQFARTWVSNPGSGELVLGHLIVMAELGLCSYAGRAPRDPATFRGGLTRPRRAAHVLARAAFTRALWALADPADPMLYRGLPLAGGREQRPVSLVSATFSRRVAESHFDTAMSGAAVLFRQRLPAARLFMTFLETDAMSLPFAEAEAVLFAEGTHGI